MLSLLLKQIFGGLADFFRGLIADWRRDENLKKQGADEAELLKRKEHERLVSDAQEIRDTSTSVDDDLGVLRNSVRKKPTSGNSSN